MVSHCSLLEFKSQPNPSRAETWGADEARAGKPPASPLLLWVPALFHGRLAFFFFLTVENAVVCSCTVLYFSASISKDLLSDCKCKFPINSSQGGGHVVHHGCFCGRWGGRTSQDSGQLGRQHHMSPVLGS